VANLLHTRKDRVLIVHGAGEGGSSSKSAAADGGAAAAAAVATAAAGGLLVEDVRRPESEPHIERILVAKVIELHSRFRGAH
jgi:hypothetical protein